MYTQYKDTDSLEFSIILNFIKDLTDGALVGFIMSTHDEQDVYLRHYVGENEMYASLFTGMAAMQNSIVEIIQTYFGNKMYEAFVAHYV